MTIQQAIDRIDTLKPNKFEIEQKVAWLSALDGMVHREILMAHEGLAPGSVFHGYDCCRDMNRQLLVMEPYEDIYQHYLATQMDIANAESGKYAQDKVLFNNAWVTFGDYWTRTHMPRQRVTEFRL